MELNVIIIEILEALMSGDGKAGISDLSVSLGVSKRTLLYNLKKLNDALRQNGLPQVTASENSLHLDCSGCGEIRERLLGSKGAAYILSAEERKALILLSAGLIGQNVTVDWLCSFMEVSKNTVLGDVAGLKRELMEPGIQMISRARQGYHIQGDELTIRYCIYEYLSRIGTEHTKAMADRILFTAVEARTGKKFEKDEIFSTVYGVIKQAESCVMGKYNHDSLAELAYYVLLILCRSGHGSLYISDECLKSSKEFEAAGDILQSLGEAGLMIPMEECPYLAAILLGSKRYSYHEIAAQSMVDLGAFAGELIDTFETKACVRFGNRGQRIDQFLVHLRPMYYRLKYHVKVRNQYADEIRTVYSGIYDLTLSSVRAIEGRYGLSVPADEIAYICVYFASWLKQQRTGRWTGARCILIVCGAGIGTSLLLRQQITDILGMGYRYETKDFRESAVSDTLRYDMVVTTVDLPYHSDKILKVNPILTARQKEKLLAWSFSGSGGDELLARVEQVIAVAEQYATINNRSKLAINLRRYFENNGEPQEMPRLWDVLTEPMVRVCGHPLDERRAVAYACEALLSAGLVDAGYAGSVWEIIDRMGLYSEIIPGVLLAHAHPSSEVNGVGLSLTVFPGRVQFEKWEKDIAVIATLCAVDNQSHSLVLHDLIRLLEDDSVKSALLDCPYKTGGELYRFLLSKKEE